VKIRDPRLFTFINGHLFSAYSRHRAQSSPKAADLTRFILLRPLRLCVKSAIRTANP
jgi:hypothetical protein